MLADNDPPGSKFTRIDFFVTPAPQAAKGRAGQRDVMLAASRSRQKE